MSKFEPGDICTCSYHLRGKINGSYHWKKDCQVRIIRQFDPYTYNVYNIDFSRYEKVGAIYLKKNIQETRNKKIEDLLND